MRFSLAPALTLRRWEKKGKLRSIDGTEGGHRRCRVADLLKIYIDGLENNI